MMKRIDLNPEQTRAYNRFIIARNKVFKNPTKWIRLSEISESISLCNLNHPLFVVNDEYVEYKEAFLDWLKVEPRFRQEQRMRSSRGDYGIVDNWDEKVPKVKEL